MVFEGKFGIKATVLADSVSSGTWNRMTTLEIEYPRIILAELNTHRMLPKNSHSSRAIPFNKMKEQLTGRPVRFGQANPGMQDKGGDFDAPVVLYFDGVAVGMAPEQAWKAAKADAVANAKALYEAGYHKQVYNRLTEPFQMMRTVISGTEWENFFWLRDHEAADPTLHELARTIRVAMEASDPQRLLPGEWHVPYVQTQRGMFPEDEGTLYYYIKKGEGREWLKQDEAVKVSAARCAAVSFRNEDYGLEKCLEVHERLVGDDRKHASAFEHQATPMQRSWDYDSRGWEPGISHKDRMTCFWSGPLKGFIQYRKLIPGENYNGK